MDPRLKDVLQHIIPGLSESELEDFASLWTISKTIKKDGYLYPKGIADSNVYLIETGALKTVHKNEDQEIIVGFWLRKHFYFRSDLIFHLHALQLPGPGPKIEQTLGHQQGWSIPLIAKQPDLGRILEEKIWAAAFEYGRKGGCNPDKLTQKEVPDASEKK